MKRRELLRLVAGGSAGALAQSGGCAITRIGRIVPQAEGLSVRGPDGTTYTPAYAGYDHFR